MISLAPTLKSVNILVDKLILRGRSTINLTPMNITTPDKPQKQPGQRQALADNNSPHDGAKGLEGLPGAAGKDGVSLNLTITLLDSANGSLWIKTDGTPGGPGGDGGDGGKGSSGPRSGISNPNGGNGGGGGRGGESGKGGNTARVTLKIGRETISPTQATGVAPSNRPSLANTNGVIVISGAPGEGAPGGMGGKGGDGGEGHKGGPLTTDSNSGKKGPSGTEGPKGPNGKFVP